MSSRGSPPAPASGKAGDVLAALVRAGEVSEQQALEAASRRPASPELYLMEIGAINDVQLARARAEAWGMPFVRLDEHASPDGLLPPELSRMICAVSVQIGDRSFVAIADPADAPALDLIRRVAPDVRLVVAPESDIRALILRGETAIGAPLETIPAEEAVREEETLSLDRLQEMARGEPAVRMVNAVLAEAIRRGSSDVHLELHEYGGVVRMRCDGALQRVSTVPRDLARAATSRIKILAGLDIAEQRLPQDGQFRLRFGGREFDVRVSTVPGVWGECAVMRLLDRSASIGSFAALGFGPEDEEAILAAIARPHGIILVTGPTGSGKSTTLAAMMRRISRPEIKVLTVEDPVEYRIPGATQVQVNERAGLTFARALRAFLRHDPDVIMVGEIRDPETAQIALRAAMTGHLVLSTLHTNDAAGAVPRLADMGAESYLLADALLLVVAQRLVRKVCPECAEQVPVAAELRARVPDFPSEQRKGRGCGECGGTGYKGRTVIAETLPADRRVREMVARGANADQIRDYVFGELGRTTMLRDGARKVALGITTAEEVVRVAAEV